MQATWAADAPAHARPPLACCANLARATAEQSSALTPSVVNGLTCRMGHSVRKDGADKGGWRGGGHLERSRMRPRVKVWVL